MRSDVTFSHDDIVALLGELGDDLADKGMRAEMFIVGGAAMSLVYNTRRTTRDIDAVFEPKMAIYAAARRLAERHNLSADWLNDAVKGLLPGKDPNAREYFQRRGISVSVPSPQYLLALKVAAARVDRDADDIRALATICGLTTAGEVLAITEQVMGSRANLLPKVQFLVEEMFPRCRALTRSGGRCRNPRGSCPHH